MPTPKEHYEAAEGLLADVGRIGESLARFADLDEPPQVADEAFRTAHLLLNWAKVEASLAQVDAYWLPSAEPPRNYAWAPSEPE